MAITTAGFGIKALEAERRALEGRLEELETVRSGLLLAVRRYGLSHSDGPKSQIEETAETSSPSRAEAPDKPVLMEIKAPSGHERDDAMERGVHVRTASSQLVRFDAPDLLKLKRADIVMRIVRGAGRPISSDEVYAFLRRLDRDDDYAQVRSSLGHLKRIGKIERVGHGLWEPVDKGAENGEAPAATGASEDNSTAGRR